MPGTPVSSTNKTDRHDITEITTITLTLYFMLQISRYIELWNSLH